MNSVNPNGSDDSCYIYCTTGPLLKMMYEGFPRLSKRELVYLNKLKEIPFETFRFNDAFEGEQLHDLGQEIFDDFKWKSWGSICSNSYEGRQALKKIADALPLCCPDGEERRELLDVIWTGVGDSHWQWHFLNDGYRRQKK